MSGVRRGEWQGGERGEGASAVEEYALPPRRRSIAAREGEALLSLRCFAQMSHWPVGQTPGPLLAGPLSVKFSRHSDW